MSCDSYTSIDVDYDEILCELQALQLKHNPMYCGVYIYIT